MLVVGVAATTLVGCTSNDSPITDNTGDRTTDMSNVTEQQLRDVVVIAANDTLQALGLEPFANVNDVKITTCTDAFGADEDERFSRFAKNPPISDTELTNEQITNLAETLGIEFSEDSQNSFGTRRLAFSVDIDGINVLVSIVRDPDGTAGIATSTLCLG